MGRMIFETHFSNPFNESDDLYNIDYCNYIEKHGCHFTDKLAEYASSLMENNDGSSHKWTVKEVHNAIKEMDIAFNSEYTYGDLTYAANMAYSDFYPSPLSSEKSCLEYACKMTEDKDGYKGMIFKRWCADMNNKKLFEKKFNWDEFV